MTKRHVVYVVSLLEKSLAFEWVLPRLSVEYQVTVILLNPAGSPFESYLIDKGIRVVRIKYRSKTDFPIAFFRTFFFLFITRPQIVHAHLIDAQLIGLGAAWLARISRRMYTRHTSTFHHNYAKGGVWYDKLCNRLSTRIVSISQATDYALVNLEGVVQHKITRIPHGFRFEEFTNPSAGRIEAVKTRWRIPDKVPRIGVVARHIEWKGVEYVIAGFRKFLAIHPDAVLILANSIGPDHNRVVSLLSEIPPKNVVQISFEEDLGALFYQFDVYVHTPVDRYCEAFGQTCIEAMACGIPSILTRSGIAAEFVQDKVHALVVDYRNSDAIEAAMEILWRDSLLRERLSSNGKKYVEHHFAFSHMIDKLVKLYNE
jgi:glycosyltransferase involved in cell wall biosynthesis